MSMQPRLASFWRDRSLKGIERQHAIDTQKLLVCAISRQLSRDQVWKATLVTACMSHGVQLTSLSASPFFDPALFSTAHRH